MSDHFINSDLEPCSYRESEHIGKIDVQHDAEGGFDFERLDVSLSSSSFSLPSGPGDTVPFELGPSTYRSIGISEPSLRYPNISGSSHDTAGHNIELNKNPLKSSTEEVERDAGLKRLPVRPDILLPTYFRAIAMMAILTLEQVTERITNFFNRVDLSNEYNSSEYTVRVLTLSLLSFRSSMIFSTISSPQSSGMPYTFVDRITVNFKFICITAGIRY